MIGDFTFSVNNHKHPPEVFRKKDVTGKHLCQNLFFNKVTCLNPAILLKKRLWHRCFSVNFATFLRTPEHLRWLPLNIVLIVIVYNIFYIRETMTRISTNQGTKKATAFN